MPAVELVTQAEYARRRGVDRAAVHAAIKSGRITTVEKDGRVWIDPEVADIQWAKNTQEKYSPKARKAGESASVVPVVDDPAAGPIPGYDRSLAAAKRETHEANLAQMRELREAGSLLERQKVEKGAADAGALVRQALERVPGLALELAAMSDAVAIRNLLSEKISEVLADLSDSLRRLAGSQRDAIDGGADGRP